MSLGWPSRLPTGDGSTTVMYRDGPPSSTSWHVPRTLGPARGSRLSHYKRLNVKIPGAGPGFRRLSIRRSAGGRRRLARAIGHPLCRLSVTPDTPHLQWVTLLPVRGPSSHRTQHVRLAHDVSKQSALLLDSLTAQTAVRKTGWVTQELTTMTHPSRSALSSLDEATPRSTSTVRSQR
eukprot:2186962-Prymnesium_polylepis.2